MALCRSLYASRLLARHCDASQCNIHDSLTVRAPKTGSSASTELAADREPRKRRFVPYSCRNSRHVNRLLPSMSGVGAVPQCRRFSALLDIRRGSPTSAQQGSEPTDTFTTCKLKGCRKGFSQTVGQRLCSRRRYLVARLSFWAFPLFGRFASHFANESHSPVRESSSAEGPDTRHDGPLRRQHVFARGKSML